MSTSPCTRKSMISTKPAHSLQLTRSSNWEKIWAAASTSTISSFHRLHRVFTTTSLIQRTHHRRPKRKTKEPAKTITVSSCNRNPWTWRRSILTVSPTLKRSSLRTKHHSRTSSCQQRRPQYKEWSIKVKIRSSQWTTPWSLKNHGSQNLCSFSCSPKTTGSWSSLWWMLTYAAFTTKVPKLNLE